MILILPVALPKKRKKRQTILQNQTVKIVLTIKNKALASTRTSFKLL